MTHASTFEVIFIILTYFLTDNFSEFIGDGWDGCSATGLADDVYFTLGGGYHFMTAGAG